MTDGLGPAEPQGWSYPSAPPTAWPVAPAPPPAPSAGPPPAPTPHRGWALGLALGVLCVVMLAVAGASLLRSDASDAPSATARSPTGRGASSFPGAPWDPGAPSAAGAALESPMDPRVVGGQLVVLDLDDIVAVDGEDLSPVWRIPCPAATWASPISSRNDDIDIVTCIDEHTAFDGRTGEVLWTRPMGPPTDRVRVGPTALLLQSDDTGVTVIDLQTGDHRFDVDAPVPANVAADQEHLYRSTDGGVDAYDLSTGDEVWSVRTAASGLIATEAGVFARTNDHRVLRLDPATGDTTQANDDRRHDALAWSDFVAADDDVVVLRATQGDSTVSVYDAATLELLWSLPGEGQTMVGAGPGLVAIADVGREDVTVYDALSGDAVDSVTGIITASPVIVGELMYLTELDEGDGSTELLIHQLG